MLCRNFALSAVFCFFILSLSASAGSCESTGGNQNQNQNQTSMANAEGGTGVGIGTGGQGGQGGAGGDSSAVVSVLTNPVSSAELTGSSNSGVSGSGNSGVSIVYKYPIEFITPQMIQPQTFEGEIFSVLVGARLVVNGISVIVVGERDLPAIRFGMSAGKVVVLGTAQNHGKQFLATLHPRDQEYVGPTEQIGEMMTRMPNGTQFAFVELRTLTHSRGLAGAGATGEQNGKGLTSQISANLSGSTTVPYAMTTITFLDRKIEIVNCNDPAEHSNTLCK